MQPSAIIMAIGPWVLLVMPSTCVRFDICHKKCSAQVDGMIIYIDFVLGCAGDFKDVQNQFISGDVALPPYEQSQGSVGCKVAS